MKTKPTTLKQQLSKDMKKQGHVTKKKPSNKTLSSEEALAETPKKGTYREPNSKKLSSETSLQKSHKLVHLKEFSQFIEESVLTKNDTMESNFIKESSQSPKSRDYSFKKLAKEYLYSEEAEKEVWGNEESRAIEVFAKWLDKKAPGIIPSYPWRALEK